MNLWFHLAGDQVLLAKAEAQSLLHALGARATWSTMHERLMEARVDACEGDVQPWLPRLGLTRTVVDGWFSSRPPEWRGSHGYQPAAPFAVRAVRLDPKTRWTGATVQNDLGRAWAKTVPVNLSAPEEVVTGFLCNDDVHVGRQLWTADPSRFAARAPNQRTFIHPVVTDPRIARAMVNLAQPPPAGVVWDPFCGTGGHLLEAADMGLRVVGSDVDPRMVEGTRANLAQHGWQGTVLESDVRSAPQALEAARVGRVDAVVSDLPFGRSASTRGVARESLYEDAFAAVASCIEPGTLVCFGMPDEASARHARPGFAPLACIPVRVHGSLTRYVCVHRRT